jgi:hypothetical protein
MSEASFVLAEVMVCVLGDSAMGVGLDLGVDGNIMVLSSVFFPWLVGTLTATRFDICSFERAPIVLITIPRHVQNAFHIAVHFHRFHLKQILN